MSAICRASTRYRASKGLAFINACSGRFKVGLKDFKFLLLKQPWGLKLSSLSSLIQTRLKSLTSWRSLLNYTDKKSK